MYKKRYLIQLLFFYKTIYIVTEKKVVLFLKGCAFIEAPYFGWDRCIIKMTMSF